eukprot:scaffold21302_cov50-Phaeocystis_antarctica.AAC.8
MRVRAHQHDPCGGPAACPLDRGVASGEEHLSAHHGGDSGHIAAHRDATDVIVADMRPTFVRNRTAVPAWTALLQTRKQLGTAHHVVQGGY